MADASANAPQRRRASFVCHPATLPPIHYRACVCTYATTVVQHANVLCVSELTCACGVPPARPPLAINVSSTCCSVKAPPCARPRANARVRGACGTCVRGRLAPLLSLVPHVGLCRGCMPPWPLVCHMNWWLHTARYCLPSSGQSAPPPPHMTVEVSLEANAAAFAAFGGALFCPPQWRGGAIPVWLCAVFATALLYNTHCPVAACTVPFYPWLLLVRAGQGLYVLPGTEV